MAGFDQSYVEPLRLRSCKECGYPEDEEIKLKLESLLQRVLAPSSEEDGDFNKVAKDLEAVYPNVVVDFNVKVDELGNTPLHWLASVANVELVDKIVEGGGDMFVGDNEGETALVKAVKCVNNYERGTFEALLKVLFPCILIVDNKNRTIFHHIAISSGQNGYAVVAKYYLDVLMGWFVNHTEDVTKIFADLDLKWLISNVMNVVDTNGDTCLNIAARLGSLALVESFMDYGVDSSVANKNGLKATDFDVNSKLTNDTKDIKEMMLKINQVVSNIEKEYENEMETQNTKIENLYKELNEKRRILAKSRESLAQAKEMTDNTILLMEQLKNVKNHMKETQIEEEMDNDHTNNNNNNNTLDTLNTVKSSPTEQEHRAVIEGYKRNNLELHKSMESIKQKQRDLESKFRRVLSLCLKIDEHKVDAMLDGLLQAISSDDPQDLDTDEMQHFLKKHAPI